jgi:hypothetical protein
MKSREKDAVNMQQDSSRFDRGLLGFQPVVQILTQRCMLGVDVTTVFDSVDYLSKGCFGLFLGPSKCGVPLFDFAGIGITSDINGQTRSVLFSTPEAGFNR